jgi:GAF domain-containing protein/HAMP domain-containing protein
MSIPDNLRLKITPQTAANSESANREQSINMLTIVISTLSALATLGLFILLADQVHWQLIALAGLFIGTVAAGFAAIRYFYPRGNDFLGLMILNLLFGLSMMGSSAMLSGIGFPAAIIFLIFTLIISSSLTKNWQANVVIGSGILISGLAALLTDFSPIQQLSIKLIDIFIPAILGVLFMIYVVMLAMQFVSATLRVRLVTAFLAIVIIPLSLLSAIQSQFLFDAISKETNNALQLAARQTASGLDNFLGDIQRSITDISKLDILSRYLELPEEQRAGSQEEAEMKIALQVLNKQERNSSAYLTSYGLIDMNGHLLYDTLSERVNALTTTGMLNDMGIDPYPGTFEGDQDYFLVPARSGVAFTSHMQVVSSHRGFQYFSAPVKNKTGQTLGVLRVRFDGQQLQSLISQYNYQLGDQSYAILFDENNIRLADAFTPSLLYKSVAPLPPAEIDILKANGRLPKLPNDMLSTDLAVFNKILNGYQSQPFFSAQISFTEQPEIGAITRINTMPWKVVYLQADFSDALLRKEQSKLTTFATTLVAVLIASIAVVTAQFLSKPIIQLISTAQRVTEGDLTAQAPDRNSDEFGMLGSAFNLMTHQLRTLISQLEERVSERTQEVEAQNEALSNRARQIQTVSDVARQIVSAQELETFLSSITHLVSDRFGFYHTGIFLLDDNREYALLRAANSEGGQRMLARRHMLQVGKVGIVGHATGSGEAVIATDVGDNAVYFNNPDLPDTRSEIALPLKVGDATIGALDIQSTEANAFHPDDIELFTTLADQIAIAIYNNQLYTETLRALDEAQNVHRQYLNSEWGKDTSQRKVLGYLYNQMGTVPQQEENPLWNKVFENGEPVYAILPNNNGSTEKAIMAVPISIRGETIGVIHVQDQGENRMWSEDEITVVNSVASQVAIALENARLFENTVRRAEREKKVMQITAKIRSTNDPNEMMQIAVSEIQQALLATRTQIYVRQDDDSLESEGGL